MRTFKLSRDRKFSERVQDVVGPYLDPPQHAVVPSVDEKSQVQFAKPTRKRLRRGRFRGIVGLQAAIHRFIAEHDRTAKRFVWTADPDRIIAGVNKAKRRSALDHGIATAHTGRSEPILRLQRKGETT